jgi:hypothetical protein
VLFGKAEGKILSVNGCKQELFATFNIKRPKLVDVIMSYTIMSYISIRYKCLAIK